ncbi:peptide-methionine (S)-S-oxide reductase MsrA [Antrihabitans sp. NCIMB 15449]|uniref:Peptide methionine sulfoxide reductase MsrA n=1 Tax=Antrihabitans spumae TaxID=3373370 RepID=A0ABW7JIV3_9NOCA
MRSLVLRVVAALLLGAAATACSAQSSPAPTAQPTIAVPAPATDAAPTPARTETAVFAGGCFWGVQGVYQHVKGVIDAVSGYTGGAEDTANYDLVTSGTTGHAEAVEITFDPTVVSYGTLLQIFFTVVADPTTLNRQGPDRGTQYRTEIFGTTPQQSDIADAYIEQLTDAGTFPAPIVTKVSALGTFYPAEAYHQNYLVENPDSGYIIVNDQPKVDALQELFPREYLSSPTLTAVD